MKKHLLTLITLLSFSLLNLNAQVTASWTPLSSGVTNDLLGVSAPSDLICYASGTSGKIIKTTNGGLSWTSQTSGTASNLYSVFFVDPLNGFAAGDGGVALKTTNGGGTWSMMSLGTTSNFRSIFFLNATTGFIVGGPTGSPGEIYKTINSGATWTLQPTSGASTSGLYGIYFTSSNVGYANDYGGNIIKTTNGGSSWTSCTVTAPTIFNGPMYFQDLNKGFTCGLNGEISMTTNAGSTWTSVTSGTTNALTGIDFYDSSNGFMVGGNVTANTGIILTTTNGGITWSQMIPGTSRLYRVDMVNANTGYVVGLNGTILKYASNVGITENNLSTVKFNNFPNPFSTNTIIDLGSYQFKNEITVEVYDLTGKLVMNKLIQNQNKILIERNSLSEGMYIYKILDGNTYVGSGKMTIK